MGAILTVCDECARYGTPLHTLPSKGKLKQGKQQVHALPRTRYGFDESIEVVEDYAERIRSAREALGWTKEILAERVKEKVSVIRRIEAGEMVPPISLARKLESILKIKLLEPSLYPYPQKKFTQKFELTLGDIAKIKIKHNKDKKQSS